MVFKLFQNIKKADRGTTLVELIVVVFIIALFSLITVSNFPQIQKQYALSAAAYSLAQDIRAAEDMGLSGAQIAGTNGTIPAKGYGFYVQYGVSATKYLIYADVISVAGGASNQKYDGNFNTVTCNSQNITTYSDCLVFSAVDISKINSSLSISKINDFYGNSISGSVISINFMPPTPIVNIIDYQGVPRTYPGIQIVLSNDGGTTTRKVLVNSYGLISVQ